jgi:NADPH-dependent ferric siderophore reductase
MDRKIERTPFMRPPLPEWTLTVVEAFDVTPRMRRVIFTGEKLASMDYRPGQALVLAMPPAGRRHGPARLYDQKLRSRS